MAARSMNKSRNMDELLQLVLEADDDADLSAAVEHFYVLGGGLKREIKFRAILKAFKLNLKAVSSLVARTPPKATRTSSARRSSTWRTSRS